MAARIIAVARGCVGARFRLHGRSAATGLDCVGVAAVAYGAERVPAGYALRGGRPADAAAAIDAAGLIRVAGDPAAGDLLLVETGPYQLHLLILTGDGFIHADAGLRRVTEVPGAPPWPSIAAWRPHPNRG